MRHQKFIIFCLPRSRSAWLAAYLSYGGRVCEHDLAVQCPGIEDFFAVVESDSVGAVETGAVIGWRLIRHRLPSAKLLVVRRPTGEVIDSFRRLGIEVPASEIEQRAQQLDELSAAIGVPTVQFKSLRSEECCAWLFHHCLGTEHDHAWWRRLAAENIQINMPERVEFLRRHHTEIERTKAAVIAAQKQLPLEAQCAA